MRGFGLIDVVPSLPIMGVSVNRQRTVMVSATAQGTMVERDVTGERMQQDIRHAMDAAERAPNSERTHHDE